MKVEGILRSKGTNVVTDDYGARQATSLPRG